MEQSEILSEVKKAIDFFNDKTYDESAFYSHILSIINKQALPADHHKEQMERLLFKVDELQQNQALYWSGHKNLLPACKRMEKELIQKIQYLLSPIGGYSISRFKATKPVQKKFF